MGVFCEGNIAAVSLLCVIGLRSAEGGRKKAPNSFVTLEDVRAWADEKKGFGEPSGVEFDLGGIRLYVTYRSPFSGRAGVYSDAYYLDSAAKKWVLIDSFFSRRTESCLMFTWTITPMNWSTLTSTEKF